MSKLHFLITAGPTAEPLDPVRYLSNRSSGKMGYALAQAALDAGHGVTLISGPTALTPPKDCHFIAVQTACDMLKAVAAHFRKADVIIKTAAVADYRPVRVMRHKIKKTTKAITIRLIPNPDILKILGAKKRDHQILVGFAAETRNLVANALRKIRKKNLDWIVVNDVSRGDIGMGSDNNEVALIRRNGLRQNFAKQSKTRLAKALIKAILTPNTK